VQEFEFYPNYNDMTRNIKHNFSPKGTMKDSKKGFILTKLVVLPQKKVYL